VKVLVLAPHPDDEVLGPGGTVARWVAEGASVDVVIVTKACPPLFDDEDLRVGRTEARAAHEVLGIANTKFLDFPAAGLDTVAHSEVNAGLQEVFVHAQPDVVLIPFGGDLHSDHQEVFRSAMVCARPGRPGAPRAIYAYETLSETNWNAPLVTPGFVPNVFVDISDHLETKLRAMECYRTQLREFPHERSLEAIRVLASLRGATVGCRAAEAFVMVRTIL
jgi:LmbE family N-acetylglucosaminyl deacetylase